MSIQVDAINFKREVIDSRFGCSIPKTIKDMLGITQSVIKKSDCVDLKERIVDELNSGELKGSVKLLHFYGVLNYTIGKSNAIAIRIG